MAYQLERRKAILLILILLALTVFVVTAVTIIGNNSGGDLIAFAVEGAGSPVNGIIEQNISPWGIDAGRAFDWSYYRL